MSTSIERGSVSIGFQAVAVGFGEPGKASASYHPPRGTDHVGEGGFLTEGALGILVARFAPRGLGCPGGIVRLSFSRCFICNGRDFTGR
jgi:hypothetical protein